MKVSNDFERLVWDQQKITNLDNTEIVLLILTLANGKQKFIKIAP